MDFSKLIPLRLLFIALLVVFGCEDEPEPKDCAGVEGGHGGTLDPQAKGVLPILLGQATRLMEYLVNTPKLYRTDIVLGTETDTYDNEGSVVEVRDVAHLRMESIREALSSFVGVTYQVPPMYSALKREGRRLYELARAGKEVTREVLDIHGGGGARACGGRCRRRQ